MPTRSLPRSIAELLTLFRRSGRKIFGTGWHHDPLGVGRDAVAWGNNWVVLGVLVDLPFISHRALYQLPSPRRPHQRGRPPSKGARLPDLHHLAGLVATPFTLHQATLYGKPRT